MRRVTRVLSISLILCLAAGSAALWARAQKESVTVAPSADPLGTYSPAITISLAFNVGDSFKFPKGDSIESNVWTRAYHDLLGVDLDYSWLTSSGDQYNEKVNVAIASGELPDFLLVDKNQLARLAKTDLILKDLQPMLQKYGSPLLKDILTQEGTLAMDAASFGGKLDAIPLTSSSIDWADFLWIRTDWLGKLGLQPPKTYQDLLKIMDAFTTRDPNGTGQTDYVGLALTKDLVGSSEFAGGGYADIEGFCSAFHAYPSQWIMKNGRLVKGSYQPEMRKALQELQRLYAAGKLDKEFAVKDGGKESELAVAGRNGISYGAQWNSIWPLQANRDNNPKADWKAFPLVSADSQPAQAQIAMGTSQWYVINKKAKNPEAIVKMLNLYVEKYWGATAETGKYAMATIDNQSYEVFKFAVFVAWPAKQGLDAYRHVQDALKSGSTSRLNPEELDYFNRNASFKKGDDKEWGYARIFGENGAYGVMDMYDKGKLFHTNAFYGADTPTMTSKGSSIAKLELETFTRIIMGASISEFDSMVDSISKLGGADIEKEVNEWYAGTKR